MKKVIFAVIIVCSIFAPLMADTIATDAASATQAAQTGISINPGGFSSTGINGQAIRFLDSKGEGFEIPFNVGYSDTNDTGAVYPDNVQFSASTGIKFIRPFYTNDFLRMSSSTGIIASYSSNDQKYDNIYAKDEYYTYSVGVTAVGGIEAEVFLDKPFSLPSHCLSLATGLSLNVGYSFGETTDNFVDKTNSNLSSGDYSKKTAFSANITSFGTTLSTITIRYYF